MLTKENASLFVTCLQCELFAVSVFLMTGFLFKNRFPAKERAHTKEGLLFDTSRVLTDSDRVCLVCKG